MGTRKNYLVIWLLLLCTVATAQPIDGDYRTSATGNWSNIATWQTRVSSNWVAATVIPTVGNNVYIQTGHVITVDIATAACDSLSLCVNNSPNNCQLSIGGNTLEVSGSLRTFTTPSNIAVTATGGDGTFYTDQTAVNSAFQNNTLRSTAGVGKIRYVGNSRNIFVDNKMSAGFTSGIDIEFALATGQIGTIETAFKGRNITFNSGTYILTNGSDIRPDDGNVGGGTLTINSGVTLELATNVSIQRSGTASSTAHCGAITLASGATIEYKGAPASIGASTITFNGTVWYSSNSNQTLVTIGGNSSSALPNVYTDLTLNAGTKTLAYNTTVNGVLSMSTSSSAVPVLALGANTLTYGSAATLQYRGIGSTPPAQTTTNIEWPPTGSSSSIPPNVEIFTTTPVTLNSNKTITGDVKLAGGVGVESKVNLGAFNLSAATITRANPDGNKYIIADGTGKFILQNIGSTNVLYPIGTTGGLYHPTTLVNTGTIDNYGISIVTTTPACLAPASSVNTEWNISEEVTGGSYVGMIIDYTGAPKGILFSSISAKVAHCNGTVIDASSGSTVGDVITAGPFTEFSPFGITSIVSILPVKIISFTATPLANSNKIDWHATDEENVIRYELQKSNNGISFTTIASKAKQNGFYYLLDVVPNDFINYYRLKIIKTDGTFEYSNVIKTIQNKNNKAVAIYPTATTSSINVVSSNNIINSYAIYNNLGKLVRNGNFTGNTTINVSLLATGVYYIKINNYNFTFTKH